MTARCAVCGGPFADGSGCEFCPAVVHVAGCTCGQQGICTRCVLASLSGELPAPYSYYACSCCGHVETRQSDVEPPAKCERCGTHHSALVNFGDLDAAEAMSEEVVNES